MKTCGVRPRWPTAGGFPVARTSKESLATGLLRRKAPSSRPRETIRVDARWRIGSRRSESDSFDCHLPIAGCQRLARQGCPPADKAAVASPRSRESAAAVAGRPKPVARRQTHDRWRLDDREVVRRLSRMLGGNAAFARSVSSVAGGFSQGNRPGLQKCCFCGCS